MSALCYPVPPQHGGRAFMVLAQVIDVIPEYVERHLLFFRNVTPPKLTLRITDSAYKELDRCLGEIACPPQLFEVTWEKKGPLPREDGVLMVRIEAKSAFMSNKQPR